MIDLIKHRPEGHSKKEVQTLANISYELSDLLTDIQESFFSKILVLPENELDELAVTLVEFAEDLVNKIGIWDSLEKYNIKYFGTPLPFILPIGQEMPKRILNRNRIHYFLWNKYTEFDPSLILAPKLKDLNFIAENIAKFFENRDDMLLPGCSIKVFLDQPNTYGWDVKMKLIWLGQHSYLFRHSFENFIEDDEVEKIPVIDDYVCQHETKWSGLRVPDILSGILDITQKQRTQLQSWYERHFAYYEIESIKGPIVIAKNIICKKTYTIRAGEHSKKFKLGHFYIGSLVPWNKEWYWSGRQTHLEKVPRKVVQELIGDFFQKSPQIVYRYHKTMLEKARQRIKVNYENFIKFHGDDLVFFRDGYSMAAALQKQHRLEYEAQPEEEVKKVMEKRGLKNPWPNYNYPRDLLESDNGIGVFFNPEEGLEIMREYNDVLNGFKKKGVNLAEDEFNAIRGFIEADAISINFVNKLVEQYGAESIMEAYLLRTDKKVDFLNYILRQCKGHYYRNRYPSFSFK